MLNWLGKPDKQTCKNSQETRLSGDGQRELIDKGSYQGRPVRMYSDGSVKAGTRDGWIRFRSFDEFKQHFHLS
jgi:hypothetical protein